MSKKREAVHSFEAGAVLLPDVEVTLDELFD